MKEKALRKALAARDCGSLEILVRGVDVDPDELRKRLRLKGGAPLSLVITRIGARVSPSSANRVAPARLGPTRQPGWCPICSFESKK